MLLNTVTYVGASLPECLFFRSEEATYTSGKMFSLHPSDVETRFLEVENEIKTRWDRHTEGMVFPKYTPNRSEDSLIEEFHQFDSLRKNMHANLETIPFQMRPDFKLAQSIFIHHQYRQPNCITFEHSKTDDSYNSSCVMIGERKFFALEGPTERTLEAFYRLLTNWNVYSLVCLTGEEENGMPKCFPYWNGRVCQKNGESFFAVPIEDQYLVPQEACTTKKLPFVHLPQWADHHALDVNKLLEEANRIRKKTPPNEIMAIHCSAGVGRTGTFLAIISLLDEIDRQKECGTRIEDIELSIPELFMKINLYRRPLVAKEPQYISLYRVVDTYLDSLKMAEKIL